MNNRENRRIVLYLVAGIYLLYLAFSMARGFNETAGTERVIISVATVAFLIIGACLTVWSVRIWWKQMKGMMEGAPEEDSETAEELEAEEDSSEVSEEKEDAEAVKESDGESPADEKD